MIADCCTAYGENGFMLLLGCSPFKIVVIGGHAFEKGNRWEGERGNREQGGGGSIQPSRDQSGQESASQHKGGISKQVRGEIQGIRGGISKQQKEVIRKGLGACTSMYISC
jgi:hypothetical protein